MLPPEGVLKAARRWADLLQRSSVEQAMAIIKADPSLSDLSVTQYAAGLDWLQEIRLVVRRDRALTLSPSIEGMPLTLIPQALFAAALEYHEPSWLPEADTLVIDPGTLPQDAENLARVFGLASEAAYAAIQQLWSKVDAAELDRVGAAGEAALVEALERRWPGSVIQVSLQSDAYGYDVAFSFESASWHLEVKTTPRRGRLAIYLSRHECAVAARDGRWRLVVVGLDPDGTIGALATAPTEDVLALCPRDTSTQVQWRTARFNIHSKELRGGLGFLPVTTSDPSDRLFAAGSLSLPSRFAWMPSDDAGSLP